jgi:hypothetical protein
MYCLGAPAACLTGHRSTDAKAGGAQAAKSASRSGIATDEALKILEVQKSDLLTNPVRIQQVGAWGLRGFSWCVEMLTRRHCVAAWQQFEKYLAQNDPAKGGSFYLQVRSQARFPLVVGRS